VVVVAWACLHHEREPSLPADFAPRSPSVLAVDDPPGSVDELRARIGKILDREHVPGASIALVDRDGPVWIGGIGVRDVATGVPTDGDTTFRVGSLSKSIVALGAMRLVDQGKLDLDRPLREILPGVIDNPWEAHTPVTLAQLMEHTAGLDDVRFNEIFTDDEGLPVSEALALNPRSRIVRWPPGTRHAYANGAYTIVARAIEVVTGEPFDVYLRREILQPLGIRDADFRRTDVLASRLATGYYQPGRPVAFHPFAHRPSASLLISARELAKLVQFWLRRGDGFPPIVSRAGLARIERSGTLPYAALATDYGFANYGDVMHPAYARGHDGGMPGFHASIRYFPELGVGYAMLLNSEYSYRGYFEIRSLLFSYLTKGKTFATPPVAATSEPPGADYFTYASPRSTVFEFIDRVRIGWRAFADDDGHVRLEDLSGDTVDLLPTADGGYRHRHDCGSSVRFTTSRDGVPLMVRSFLYAEGGSYALARLRYIALDLAVFLVKAAPLWAVLVLLASAIVPARRGRVPPGMVAWTAIASLSASTFMPLLFIAFDRAVIGGVHPLTIAIWAMSIVFPVASFASLYCAVRWWLRRDRPGVLERVIPTAFALALAGLALWFIANGLFAFRTWAW
jgi:CubicO group peptidase (beta-lactamase class C family)